MCPPLMVPAMAAATPYLMAATVAVSAYTGYTGMLAQKKYQNTLAINAAKDTALQQATLTQRLGQEEQAAGAELTDAHRKSRQARAMHTVAAGEAGVSGASVDALEENFLRQESAYHDRVMQNLEFKQHQAALQGKGIEAQYLGRAAQANRPLDMSWLGRTISAAGQFSGYAQGVEADRLATATPQYTPSISS